ncbi:N-succinylglutamate 5-semialdehyde dehydrogenase [Stieleria maiorica]|uniref:N-succinylglutamate 5-semialdehyde dehydrogenase n=1 Tax=Stieleria maiorica TaxID=2795974 RepID=A0A5B9MQI5_9BACT|nr:succinylglutamate-semialdehyde dehydrogenase [Stieleria maiorica]QEG01238.1 N-succinylglutamate 5-semialdehyde dehydrogenase [Stieleria maiorica]
MNSSSEPTTSMAACFPGTDEIVWEGTAATAADVADAVANARSALAGWQTTAVEDRIAVAERFAALATDQQESIANQISRETGKPKWESTAEAKLVPAKVKLAVQAYCERSGSQQIDLPQGTGRVVYRGVGVMAVLGPFNFPAHLPNGHIVPALVAGNTVVFKPSEMTPGTGELLCQLWHKAGLPHGVLQVVQGDGAVGATLVSQAVDGVLFTGSYAAGCAIHRSLAGRPEVLLALEMGGNNPLVVHRAKDLDAAAYLCAVSAYATAGQRCTCARRLILIDDDDSNLLVDRLVRHCETLRVGLPDDDPVPFCGPLISAAAADRVLDAQASWLDAGARVLVAVCRDPRNAALLRPGLVDVTTMNDRIDEEVFGPLLQVIRVVDFDAAIGQANRTAYGLSASLLSDDPALFDRFRTLIRAGVVNWNQPTVGASGRLPFGGLGASGNHRPSGYFAADYCSDAAAMLESGSLSLPATTLPGIEVGGNTP